MATHDIRKKMISFQKVQFLIKGYNETYRLDRNSKGVGIAFLITEDISSKLLSDHRKNSIEPFNVEINSGKSNDCFAILIIRIRATFMPI